MFSTYSLLKKGKLLALVVTLALIWRTDWRETNIEARNHEVGGERDRKYIWEISEIGNGSDTEQEGRESCQNEF